MSKRYAIVETVTTFKHTYAVEMKNKEDDPNQYRKILEDDDRVELAQEYLGENIIGIKVAKSKEVCRLAREDRGNVHLENEYIMKILVNGEKPDV